MISISPTSFLTFRQEIATFPSDAAPPCPDGTAPQELCSLIPRHQLSDKRITNTSSGSAHAPAVDTQTQSCAPYSYREPLAAMPPPSRGYDRNFCASSLFMQSSVPSREPAGDLGARKDDSLLEAICLSAGAHTFNTYCLHALALSKVKSQAKGKTTAPSEAGKNLVRG